MNWTIRIKNKYFWLALVPAICLLVQAVLTPFGYKWDFGVLNEQLAAIINAAFGLLSILGIVNDPTTDKVSDSTEALSYTEPKKEDK
ncbi:phage holin [Lacticaseibacillus suibinensis]|uniref:phage holin n=1 Tax=Lacticaseibacillus suibinensis TaxID=2486011 RepID=UPI0019441426|nr:phage holin [Lacticaseibacillus suibinensis]